MNTASAPKRRYLPTSPFKPPPEAPPPEQYEVDDLVTHDKYGLGRVILVEGDAAVVIDFAPRRVRITTPFARMSKL
jgi:predicted 2-oxoglutarate/Fe(II)-dependent dioxygenase YbiX